MADAETFACAWRKLIGAVGKSKGAFGAADGAMLHSERRLPLKVLMLCINMHA